MLVRPLSRLSFVILIATLPCLSAAQIGTKPLPLHSPLQDKNFYLLSVLQSDPSIRPTLAANEPLNRIRLERQHALAAALQTCKQDAACTLKTMLWTDEEIRAVSLVLSLTYRDSQPMRTLVDKQLRPAGTYLLYEKESGAALLMGAWETCARGLNEIVSVYGLGAPPRYPQIDSASIDLKSPDVQQQIASLATRFSGETSSPPLFFEPTLETALQLIALNHRDEAGRLEPMEAGVNQAAMKAVGATPWQRYDYSVIVVPGAGGSDQTTPLSEAGRRRTALAATAYHAGKAPFILVSGGYVHPSQTPFAEAIEMKKALLADFHVPEAAILVDPHARHTTTNMRNAAREIFRYGIPTDKPALVISDAAQTGYIAGQVFADRCLKELGYMPYQIVKLVSDTSIAFLPLPESLQQDPIDPLDP